jgi:hypothetical protein
VIKRPVAVTLKLAEEVRSMESSGLDFSLLLGSFRF